MSLWLLGVVTALYLGVAINEFHKGELASALVFGAYALANVGLMCQLR